MGFSVTAAHVIFAFGMLTAGSVALGSYWKVQDHIEESRRAMDDRVIDAAHTNISFTGAPSYNGSSGGSITFTIKNTGSVGLDHTRLDYLLDGAILGNMATGWPKLNGAATTSLLFLPGDALEVRLEAIGAEPAKVQVVTENAVTAHYP